jgi:hypothetical protein
MNTAFHCRHAVLYLTLTLPLTDCLLRSHKVEPAASISNAVLQPATRDQLVAKINDIPAHLRTLNATVDIATSVGGARTGKVTDYQEIRGYILVRQPGELRMIGLMPVVRTRAFDMVSNGADFKLYIPTKNRFYTGKNNVATPGATGLTALRPQVIYDALLLNTINSEQDIAVVESGSEKVQDPQTHKTVEAPDYRLDVVHRGHDGWYLERRIYFERIGLQPRRQSFFNEQGEIVSDIRYDKWAQHDNVWFPSVIEITRPVEEYTITIGMVKLTMNGPLTDEQFALVQPPDAQVIQLNSSTATASDGTRH